MAAAKEKPLSARLPQARPAPTFSASARRLRSSWILLWAVMLFAPSILLGFTATQSKFSLAAILAAFYVFWRLWFRPLPPLRGATALGLLLALYMLTHGIVLTAWTGNVIILLLEGQWDVYLLAGLLLTLDIVQARADIEWAGKVMVWLGLVASALGVVSIWTGPFYAYALHFEGRWGFLINRACGTFESPAMLSGLLLIAFVLFFFTAPAAGGVIRRQAGLVLMMATLLLTQARGSIFAAIATIVVGTPFAAKTPDKRRSAVLKMLSVAAMVAAIVYISSTYLVELRGMTIEDVQSRADVGKPILKDFAADGLAPQLFGIGFRQSASIDPETGMWFPAHNSYISFLREIGIVGCMLLGAFIFSSLSGSASAGCMNWALTLIALLLVSYTAEYPYGSYSVFFMGCAGAVADRARTLPADAARAGPVRREAA